MTPNTPQNAAIKKTASPQKVCLEPFSDKINSMFADIAGAYDFLNHLLSGGLDFYWRKVLVAELLKNTLEQATQSNHAHKPSHLKVLDLATGTFDVALSVYKKSLGLKNVRVDIAALDLCTPMLKAGKPKLIKNNAQNHILPVSANGVALPLADSSIDLACISFGIRNIQPRADAFAEFYRVLKPQGKLCVLEFGSAKNKIWGGFYNFYLDKILPQIGHLLSGDKNAYKYLAESIKEFAPAPELASEIANAGFERVSYRSLNGGIVFLHHAYKPK